MCLSQDAGVQSILPVGSWATELISLSLSFLTCGRRAITGTRLPPQPRPEHRL